MQRLTLRIRAARSRQLRLAAGALVAAALVATATDLVAASDRTVAPKQPVQTELRVWRVGSPHLGDTPLPTVPGRFRDRAAALGYRLTVESYPARDFATVFADALQRNAEPDVLTFDNFGVVEGTTTPLGTFEGIGRDEAVRQGMVRVTTVFDDLVGPTRGWAYLLRSSRLFAAAKALAMALVQCPASTPGRPPNGALQDAVARAAKAYLTDDQVSLQAAADLDRLETRASNTSPLTLGEISTCAVWGNERLMFALSVAAYDGSGALGQVPLLLGLRRQSVEWRVIVAARDPISTGTFMRQLSAVPVGGGSSTPASVLPASALSPDDGQFPSPLPGQRFGAFGWHASPSNDVIAEVAEFASDGDARLVLVLPAAPGETRAVSAGALWTTSRAWSWRVWSIGRHGEVAFSESRTFVH